ncbi:MAG: glucose-6-phosphate 1-dehydrogenase [Bacteroidetes bacterium]|jgi:glucose-6-phosphate 1-dehydrogenase|nr:glucose-6-phosphate 1-dehydrogenase [Bacteroidota bacterium]
MKKNNIENQILVIFGSNGDLAKRKLLPAIFQLFLDNLLPERFAVVGAGSQEKDEVAYRADVREALSLFAARAVSENDARVGDFLEKIFYKKVNNQTEEDFGLLKEYIEELSSRLDITKNIVYYFSIPPFLYEVVAANLVKYGLNTENDGWKRIIVEKPFGYSYDTAIDLDNKLHNGFHEDQIYRIDHYLGKETVQNIMVTRFYNGFFEPIWNRKYIDRIEITASEKIGVGNRGGYYETSGAMRDMIQNHLLQVLAVVAMEPPAIFDSDSIRNETVKVLQAMRPIKANEVADYVVRGQYISGQVGDEVQKGYRQETGVAPNSKTETFVALKVFIDNWRWGEVPFYIRTGKQLPERVTEVVIHLKPAPHQLFKQLCLTELNNMIILRIHPDAGVAIDFGMKIPGAGYKVQNVNMAFHYSDLADKKISEAYERLLLDCMIGDSTLYARADAVKASWKFVDPILQAWKTNPDIPLYFYEAGTWGPTESNTLFGDKFIKWRQPFEKFKTE